MVHLLVVHVQVPDGDFVEAPADGPAGLRARVEQVEGAGLLSPGGVTERWARPASRRVTQTTEVSACMAQALSLRFGSAGVGDARAAPTERRSW